MSNRPANDRTAVGQQVSAADAIPSNPFSTHFVRPGALPYIFHPGEDAAALVERLRAQAWHGEIVGPHGSGKSTLLATLATRLEQCGRRPLLITLHDGERSLAAHREVLARTSAETIVIIDGYEQLAFWNKWRVRWLCHRRGSGLLITAHARSGLPLLARTKVDPATAEAVFRLLAPADATVDQNDLAQALAAHPNNLREVLFELYDLHELRRHSQT